MERLRCTVTANEAIASSYYRIEFIYTPGHVPPIPGQFVTIRVHEGIFPLMRRPFAVASYDPKTLRATIIYERRGEATSLLTGYRYGDQLDIISPLGMPFPEGKAELRPVLVAGGVGMGPIFYLYEALKGKRPFLLLGARTGDRIPDDLPDGCVVCTDDGSKGFKGTVVQALEHERVSGRLNPLEIELFACGPNRMMEAATGWLRSTGSTVPAWLSMEQVMGCAVGACMGCVIKMKKGKPFARVCTEGPVFDADTIDWT